MDGDKFICARCKGAFTKTRSDEEARAEYQRDFPETQGDEEDVVCDDCYNEFMAWLAQNPQERRI